MPTAESLALRPSIVVGAVFFLFVLQTSAQPAVVGDLSAKEQQSIGLRIMKRIPADVDPVSSDSCPGKVASVISPVEVFVVSGLRVIDVASTHQVLAEIEGRDSVWLNAGLSGVGQFNFINLSIAQVGMPRHGKGGAVNSRCVTTYTVSAP